MIFDYVDRPVQAGVQEWKRRITVTTAPGEIETTATSNSTEAETQETSDGCCSSDAGGCCSSSSSQQPSCASRQTTTTPSSSTPFSSLLCYGCLTNLRDLDLKSMSSQEDDLSPSSMFELPPYVAETIVHRMGFASLDEFEHRSDAGMSVSGTAVDPQESLRAQIQEFLIASDDEDE